jgi:hypothetical protein
MHRPLPRAQLGSRPRRLSSDAHVVRAASAVPSSDARQPGNLPAHLRRVTLRGQDSYRSAEFRPGRYPLENMHCLRCNRELGAGHKSVALYMFAQTVGIKPRQKSTAHRISFCPQCAVSLAMGPPPEGALNMAAWDMIRDLVGSDPALNQAAWESLSGVLGLLPATGTDGAPRSAQAAGYFEF